MKAIKQFVSQLIADKSSKQFFLFIFLFFFCIQFQFAQNVSVEYKVLVKKADSLYDEKEFKASAFTYSEAFKANDWKAMSNDRYNAACSWALAGFPDSAFYNLERIVSITKYSNYSHITTDPDLNSLRGYSRWEILIDMVRANKEKEEANLNKQLVAQLDTIYNDDQNYRQMLDGSNQNDSLMKIVQVKDSLNLVKVEKIIDQYGWAGPDIIGKQGSTTLFLVIQHSDLKTQEKYLPLLKEAVDNGKASAADLALLTDRIEVRNNRPQVYGSQINIRNGKHELYPIVDEINVNKRRAEVGLQPLEDYVKHWNIHYQLPEK